MLAINQLKKEIATLPAEQIQEIADFIGSLKMQKTREIPETVLLSEKALAKDWDTPEEDAAWADL
ncbi:MAG: DUF2281 domain-containing protein [Defluviitaleaceae bacterium]|nr:DUF2281 domain-containing protein [Defluviitaleaceae bacterium]